MCVEPSRFDPSTPTTVSRPEPLERREYEVPGDVPSVSRPTGRLPEAPVFETPERP